MNTRNRRSTETGSTPPLQTILGLLAELCAAGGPVRASLEAHGMTASISVQPTPSEGPTAIAPLAPPGKAPDGRKLRTVHRRLLGAASQQPQSPDRLARHAGYSSAHSGVREALADLVRWNLLRHTPDGYCLPPGK